MRTLVSVLLFLVSLIAFPGAVVAAGPVEGKVTNIQNKFPDEIVFSAEASSSAGDIRSLVLHLKVGERSAERYGTISITPARSVQGEYRMKTGADSFLPAGADITYWIEAEDSAGNKLTTDEGQFWYADARFQWKKLQEGPVTVYYYGNADNVARQVTQAANDVREKIGKMLGVDARPFKVMLYNSVPDIIGAQQPEASETRRRELIRAGVAYSGPDLVQVLGVGSFGAADTARHEIGHLFVNWAGGGGVPAWLNEGLAVWSQNDPGSEYRGALQAAIASNQLLLLRGLGSFPGLSDENILAYGQSWSVIDFLVTKYGPDKMRKLLETIRAGDGVDKGLKDQYALTIDELDAAWRAKVGAPPRSYESTAPTPIAMPVIAPIGAAPPPPPGSGSSSAGGSVASSNPAGTYGLLIGAGVFGLVFVLLLMGVALVFVKRRAS